MQFGVQEFRAKIVRKIKAAYGPGNNGERGTLKDFCNLLVRRSILLTTGDIIPADLRLIEGSQLEINKQFNRRIRTGKKRIEEVYRKNSSRRSTLAYMGTVIAG